MTDTNTLFDEEEIETTVSLDKLIEAKKELSVRCLAAGIMLEEEKDADEEPRLKIEMKCGRNTRELWFSTYERIQELLSIQFEKYTFLGDLAAICSYTDGTIEAAIRPISTNGLFSTNLIFRRVFGFEGPYEQFDLESAKIILPATQDGLPRIEISIASEEFRKLIRSHLRNRITLKLSGCHITKHEAALALLNKTADSIFFQLDILSEVSLGIEKERRHFQIGRRKKKRRNQTTELQYPKTQFDAAPLSLYWYARSATGMPLLQFLAFYQVIEFYFPIYSQSEAQRKLKAILKDPTFRGDKDTDIARLLAAIPVNRSGAFGDERSQLRATLMECIEPDSLRQFLEDDIERNNFYCSKPKSSPYHKIPLHNPSVDLRPDVADRIYDIRCKIVHTKSDSRDGNVELLLPFSPEAEQLTYDVELAQYLAKQVLVAGSAPFNIHD